MPTNAVSLLLYVGLLLPGFAFTVARSRHRPIEVRSTFWETTTAVFVSVICDGVVLAAVLLAALIWPGVQNLLDQIARHPAATFQKEVTPALLVSMAYLVIATVLGFLLGTHRAHRIGAAVLRDTDERRGSTWHQVFENARPPGTTGILVELELTDGSGLQGLLSTFDRLGSDNGDRGLVLTGTIARRAIGEAAYVLLAGYSTVAVTDRNIRTLSVAYLNEPWPASE